MNIFHKVTLSSLKRNKTRTVVTVIGIMLSAAMICAVTTMVSSLQQFIFKNFVYNDGAWHGSALDTDAGVLQAIANAEEVERTVYAQQLGYAEAKDCKNSAKPYLYLLGAGEGFAEVMPIHITVGEYPKSQNEILLPEHL